jgi:type IV secretion system protein TrbL
MNDVGVIDRFFDVFGRYIDSGFGLLGGEVAFLASTLVVIDVTLAALFWAWGPGDDILARLVKKTLFVGFFAFLIGNFQRLADIVFASFSGLGLKASGSGLSAADFMRPGKLAQTGVDAGRPLLEAAADLSGFPGLFENFVQVMVLMIVFLIVIIAFFVLAVQVFVTLIEFKLTTLAGFVLIPFGLFGRTAFLAEKVLGNVVASGVKVLVLAVIVGIGSTLFESFTRDFAGTAPTLEDVLAIALAALTLMGLSIFGPGIATGLVSGAPQLGAGAAVGAGLAVGGLAMAGAAGARLAAAGGSSLAGRAGAGAAAARSRASRGAPSTGAGGPARPSGPSAGPPPSPPPAGGGGAPAATSRPSADPAPPIAATPSPPSPQKANAEIPSSSPGAAPAPAVPKPAWARAMERRQAISRGLTTAVHAVRAGDHGGAGGSVSLSEDRS